MLYPENIETKLGFDRIREMVAEACASPLGEEFVGKMSFSDKFDLVEKLLSQTEEMRLLMLAGEALPLHHILDLRESIMHLRVEGTFLTGEEFIRLALSLESLQQTTRYLEARKDTYPLLAEVVIHTNPLAPLTKEVRQKVDDEGLVKDHASPELASIRRSFRQEEQKLRKVTDQLFRHAKSHGYVPEGSSITIKGGRMVIPLLAEHKRKIKGAVVDESATGQTVYLEPAEVLEVNNALRELEYAERREVVKVLTSLTDVLRPHLPEIREAFRVLGVLDFIRAKARVAISLQACKPVLHASPLLEWHHARHPLLMLTHVKSGKPVVPLNILLDDSQRMLLISGPNAGGKSVCLKTVGLLQLMLQSGLLVPLADHSRVGIFKDLFIDIGDEQSIENDLSTYSSHLTNMEYFLRMAERRSLVLIDEFGTGTEPQFGGAIAEAILDRLITQRAMGVITTHYTNLKKYAENREGIVNAAMRFDLNKLEPLYELQVGRPGSSFALEIATKIGLPKKVLAYAREVVGHEHADLEKLLNTLEFQKQELNEREKKITRNEESLKKLTLEYNALKIELETNKKEILNKAKQEASQLLEATNKEIEKTIRHIKESKAERKETQKMRTKLGGLKEKVKPEWEVATLGTDTGEIVIGDAVRVSGSGVVGKVVAIKGKNMDVQVGDLKSTVKRDRLQKIHQSELREQLRKPFAVSSRGMDIVQKAAEFSATLDIRGKRMEEAIPLIDQFIDGALLFGRNELRILHGKGDGILRTLVRNHLKSFPMIQKIEDEVEERGGTGISIVTMK
jgi:DNA mismatch repair protein MutS2